MKKLQTKEEIHDWLIKFNITEYTLNSDLSINVYQNVEIKNIATLPVNFHIINGNLDIYDALELLEGLPKTVTQDITFFENKMENLENFPLHIGGDIILNLNNIKSLKGLPEIINGNFICVNNKLKSLADCPKIIKGNLDLSMNELTSLDGLNEVGGDINIANNKLENLKGLPQIVKGNLKCNNNPLLSLEGCPKEIHGDFLIGNKNTYLMKRNEEIPSYFSVLSCYPVYIGKSFIISQHLDDSELSKILLNIEIKGSLQIIEPTFKNKLKNYIELAEIQNIHLFSSGHWYSKFNTNNLIKILLYEKLENEVNKENYKLIKKNKV